MRIQICHPERSLADLKDLRLEEMERFLDLFDSGQGKIFARNNKIVARVCESRMLWGLPQTPSKSND
jgi:hypothetical protein